MGRWTTYYRMKKQVEEIMKRNVHHFGWTNVRKNAQSEERNDEVWASQSGIFGISCGFREICTIFLITSLYYIIRRLCWCCWIIFADEIEIEICLNENGIVFWLWKNRFFVSWNGNCMLNIPNNSEKGKNSKYSNIMSFIFVRIYSCFQAGWRSWLAVDCISKAYVPLSFSFFFIFLSLSLSSARFVHSQYVHCV